MNKEFIPYKQALALKELGFDEPCFGSYDPFGSKQLSCSGIYTYGNCIAAPLYQQAFRWFREKHNLYPSINIYHDLWMCLIKSTVSNQEHISGYIVDTINNGHPTFNTYEEAELACLNKLIEIVKL